MAADHPAPDTRLHAEDLLRIAVLDDVALSPDGHLAVVAIRTGDTVANCYYSSLFIYPIDGSPAWPLTAGQARDRAPRWSPDGRQLAFLSNRGANTQVWLIELHGEARQLTFFPHGVAEPPAWSPDGRYLVVVAWQEVDESSPAADTALDSAAGVTVVTRTSYRLDGLGYLGHRYQHIWTVEVESGTASAVTIGRTDNYAPAWSPDGERIAFVSNRADDWGVDVRSSLWVVSSRGGVAARVTPEQGVAFAPAWSPDGAYLAYSGLPADMAYGSNHQLLLATPAGDQAPRPLVGAMFEGHVGGSLLSDTWQTGAGALPLHWTPDSSAIFFVAARRGRAHLCMVDLEGGITTLVAGERACAMLSVSRDGQTLAFGTADLLHAADLYVLQGEVGGSWQQPRALTRLNPWLDERDMQQPIAFTATSADGRVVDAWLVPPVGVDHPMPGPLVLHIHGGPHSIFGCTFFFDMHYLSSQGYAVLFINPRATRSYGDDFALCNLGRWGEGDAPDQLAALDHAAAMGWVDARRIAVMGLSYGGYMVNWLIGHCERFCAAVSENGISNLLSAYGTSDGGWYFFPLELGAEPDEDPELYRRLSPLSAVNHVQTPLLLLQSEDDWNCPIEQGEQIYTALKRRGRAVEMVRFAGEGHIMTTAGTPLARVARRRHLARWFRLYLSGGAPSSPRP
jgi:dipeptidyl aminopeptidase/acylaminoacyl peptidase